MKYKINVDENNYLTSFMHMANEEDIYELKPTEMNLEYLSCYKLVNDEVVFDEEKYKRTLKEQEAEKQKPTPLETIEAQVLYTALMTDTMLEE